MQIRLKAFLVLWAVWESGCAPHRTRGLNPLGTPCPVSTTALKHDWRALSEALQSPGGCVDAAGIQCDVFRARVERLAVDCPSNPDVILANAFLKFEQRNFVRAQQLIDELAALGVENPDAAVLRARIAMQDGNAVLALRYLNERMRQFGDHAGLRETLASALYFMNRWDEAQEQLRIALALGAPGWRISYGQGLIEEARNNFAGARAQYEETLKQRPGWKPAESRLRALVAAGKSAR